LQPKPTRTKTTGALQYLHITVFARFGGHTRRHWQLQR